MRRFIIAMLPQSYAELFAWIALATIAAIGQSAL